MKEAFIAGGWGMFPTLICGVLTVLVALRYAVKPERRFVPLLVSLNVMTLIAGTLGFVTGLIAVSKALPEFVEKEHAPVGLITMIGTGEALHNVALALILMMFAAIATTIGAFRVTREQTAG